jgi:hypothetical protein
MSRKQTMSKKTFMHGKYIVSVKAKQSERGAWYPDITLVKDGVTVLVPQPETTQREWATEAEALRAGIDQGRGLVNSHNLSASD